MAQMEINRVKDIFIKVLLMIICGVVFQFAASGLLTLTLELFEDTANQYANDVEVLKTMEPTMILYVCLLAPSLEELVFRGLILKVAKRYMTFAIANIIQALLFGIYHGNIVQGIYAFFSGLIFGYVLLVVGNLVYMIILHMSCNMMGLIIDKIVPKETGNLALASISVVASAVFAVIIVYLRRKNDRLADC